MKAVLKPYSAYSTATSKWIGTVPVGWDVLPFKRLCHRVDVGIAEAATHAYAIEGVPIVRGTNIRPHRIEGEMLYIEPWFAEKNRSKYMRAGDLVTVRTGYPGVTAVIPAELDNSQCFTMIISTMKKGHSPEFYCYFFNSICGMAHFAVEGWGSAQTNISVPTVQRIEVPFPPPDEQKAVVAFLDRETAKIDRLMEVRRKQVERLGEQRTAIIHHAVTRGLNAHAKRMPSGVEWLGDVPAKWRLFRIRHLLKPGKDGMRIGPFGSALKTEFIRSEGYKVYGQENVIGRSFALGKRYVDESKYSELSEYKLRPDDLLITMMGSIGRCLVVPGGIKPGILDSHLIRIGVDRRKVCPHFLAMLIEEAPYVASAIRYESKGSIMDGLNSQIIKRIVIALPGVDEQQSILTFIDRETAKVDALAIQYRRELELLAEYRASLISHAVTGKIDVRRLVAAATSESP